MVISIPEIPLNDGFTLPVIGLGTYKLKGNEGVNVLAVNPQERLYICMFVTSCFLH